MTYVAVFFATLITDALWAYYIDQTARRNAGRSTIASGGIVVLGAYVAVTYIEDHWAIIPAVTGGMLGTWLTVTAAKRKAAQSK